MARHSRTSKLGTLALVAALATSAAACGDDEAASGDTDRFCSALIETFTTTNRTFAAIDFETTSEEEFAQIMGDLSEQLDPLFAEIEATAPQRLEDVVQLRLEVARQALETGEEDDSPEAVEAERALDEFALSECDVNSFDVTLTEYTFNGVPDTIEAGVAAFDLENTGAEDHEFGVYLVTAETDATAEQLIADDTSPLQRIGGSDAAAGDSFATFIDLEVGRYVVACLLPVDPDNPDSDTHATEGMVTEFTVD